MDRSVQKQFLANVVAGSALMVGLAVQAHAGVIPGLWRSDYRAQINGYDSIAIMAKLDAQMRSAMPTALKTNAKVGLSAIGNQGSATVCMTPQVAASLTSPATLFNLFSKMNPLCTLVAGQTVGDTVSFSGRCDDPASYTGNVSGKVRMVNTWQWNATMEGSGKFPDAVLTSMNLPAKSVVTMKTAANSSLISKTCQ